MRNFIKITLFFVAAVFGLSSCIDDTYKVTYGGSKVEFDAAVWNNPALGVTYPILTRAAGFNRAVSTTADPLLTRTSGTVDLRVNLVSKQFPSEQTVSVAVDAAASTAVDGVHYSVPATLVIPANSSFGILTVTILNPGATTGTVDLVLELTGSDQLEPSENYKKIGLRIAQN